MARTPKLDPEDLDLTGIFPDFISLTQDIKDHRREHLRVHRLDSILFIVLTANMAGITSILGAAQFAVDAYDWIIQYVPLHETPPKNKTIGRLLAAVNPERMEELIRLVSAQQMAASVPEPSPTRPIRQLAADGKVVAGSVTKHEAQTPQNEGGRHALMTVNIIDTETGLTIASAGTPEPDNSEESKDNAASKKAKPSEQALLENLLEIIDLRCTEVSVDAGHARRKVTDIIDGVGKAKQQDRAYWMMCIKGNQSKSRECIRQAFDSVAERKQDTYTEEVTSRGDSRTTRVIKVMPRFETDAQLREYWPRATTMIIIERTRSDGGSIARETAEDSIPKKRTTTSYYLSSYPHTAASAHSTIRKHWKVENGLHWILDVAYREDASQMQERTAARNLAIIRRMAKNLLVQAGGGKGGKSDQRRFAINENFRNQLFKK